VELLLADSLDGNRAVGHERGDRARRRQYRRDDSAHHTNSSPPRL